MIRVISRLHMAALYPAAWCLLHLKSVLCLIKTYWKRSRVWFEVPYRGEPILVLALFEKGQLRADVQELVAAAKSVGFYVLAVNTMRLGKPEVLQGQIDCYVERANFGRDFGSYKTGFLHVFQRGWHQNCPRILMMNDSVFFTRKSLRSFLSSMLDAQSEVIGATENFEIEHHLGSFCIGMDGKIIRNERFQAFWKNFRLSDVRPAVIQRGEMGLSRVLRRCASTELDFTALYGANRTLNALRSDDALLDFAVRNSRQSERVHWKRVDLRTVARQFQSRHMLNGFNQDEFDVRVQIDTKILKENYFVASTQELYDFLSSLLLSENLPEKKLVHELTIAHVVEVFMEGSQIHQNATLLLKMGLPIVKLDGMYRGMFSELDVQKITALLDPDEGADLSRQLLSRPYGGKILFGWRRAAFMRGLI